MTLARWATKPTELKALGHEGLVLFAARCATRFESWCPPDATETFRDVLAEVVDAAFEGPLTRDRVRALGRPLADVGARSCNALATTDEPLGRCRNYATQSLITALDVSAAAERKAQVKQAILAAKLSASIPTVWAHAGRVPSEVAEGTTVVDSVAETTWSAIRDDVARIRIGVATVASATDRVAALRELGPFWKGRPPAWANPP